MTAPKPGEQVDRDWLADDLYETWAFDDAGARASFRAVSRRAIEILGDVRAPEPERLIVGDIRTYDPVGTILAALGPTRVHLCEQDLDFTETLRLYHALGDWLIQNAPKSEDPS